MQIIIMIKNNYMLAFGLVDDSAENNNFELFSEGINCSWLLYWLINNQISLNMTFIFTIRISLRFSSAREFQMGNFQKYWSQNVGQDFIVFDFFHGGKQESDSLWCRGKLLISIKRAMNSSRIELLWLVWDQSRSKYYLTVYNYFKLPLSHF
jgi:hypothetical protein